jgi:hypothetical protein
MHSELRHLQLLLGLELEIMSENAIATFQTKAHKQSSASAPQERTESQIK